MYTQLRLRVWLVEPHDAAHANGGDGPSVDMHRMREAEFRERLAAGDRPDGLLVEAGTLERLDGHRFALDGVLRTVIVTDRALDDLPAAYLDRPSVRVLRRPFDPGDLGRALLWLEGVDDDGWATPASR